MKCIAMDNLPHRFCQSGSTDRYLRQIYDFHPSDRTNIINTCWHFPESDDTVTLCSGFEPGDSWQIECPKGVVNIRFQGVMLAKGSQILTPQPTTVRITYEDSSTILIERIEDSNLLVKRFLVKGQSVGIFWHDSKRQWCYHLDYRNYQDGETEGAFFESEKLAIAAALKAIIGFAWQKKEHYEDLYFAAKKALDDQECTELQPREETPR